MTESALGDVVVVEISRGRHEYATKLLADLGASVVTVEPLEGNPSRRIGPFAGDVPDVNGSLRYWHHNTSKRSHVADLATPAGRESVLELLRTADLLVTGWSETELEEIGLGAPARAAVNPRLATVRIAAFGTGPWEHAPASDLVQLALGGVAGVSGYDDIDGRPPVAPTGGQAEYLASMMGAIAALAALPLARRESRAVSAEVSGHDTIAVSTEMAIPFWEFQHVNVRRQTGRHAHPTPTARWTHRCSDGVYLSALPLYLDDERYAALVEWMAERDAQQDLADERYADRGVRRVELDHIVDVISAFFATMPSDEAYRGAQARRLPWAPINAPGELYGFEHLTVDREAFAAIDVAPGFEGVRFAGAPYRLSGTPWRTSRPPRLGEHTTTSEGD